jgi:plastocyanin
MRSVLLAAGLLLAATASHAADPSVCPEAEARFAKLGLARPDGPLVLLYKFTFCPPQMTVKAGATVTFVNVDPRTSHSVWFKDAGREESERFFPEDRWTTRFDTPGEYRYLCGPHWESDKMVGVLRVEK